jgi:hypothetical protein
MKSKTKIGHYDDVMNAIENNGEVTLPNSFRDAPLMSRRQVISTLVIAGTVVALVWAAFETH